MNASSKDRFYCWLHRRLSQTLIKELLRAPHVHRPLIPVGTQRVDLLTLFKRPELPSYRYAYGIAACDPRVLVDEGGKNLLRRNASQWRKECPEEYLYEWRETR